MFKTTKQALAWYANFRKGPKPPRHTYKPQVRSTARADSDAWITMAGVLRAVSIQKGVSLDLLMRWATTSDDGFSSSGKLTGAVAELRRQLEAKGLVEAKIKPTACADHVFVDLNTGKEIRTKRAT